MIFLPGFIRRDWVIQRLEAADAPAMATVHQEGFVRPWNDGEFARLLVQDPVFGFGARQEGKGGAPVSAFVLARLVAGEAEILTLAVAAKVRRQGLGRRLMDAVLFRLHAERAESLFLEVDETNVAAVTLYRRLGFRQVGKRPGYYNERKGEPPTSALVMRRDLR